MQKQNSAICSEVEKIAFPSPDQPHRGSGADGTGARPEVKEVDRREETRRSARRLVNFGWESQGVHENRSVEAVQSGKVVEGSFAKGEWGLRWAS